MKIMIAAVIAIIANFAFALTEMVDGIAWTYTITNGEATIGEGLSWETASVPKHTTGTLTVPASLGGCPVTGIAKYAFYDCSELTNVSMPDSVTSVGARAFNGCSGLTSVTIPSSVTSIGEGAFNGCSRLTAIIVDSGNNVYSSSNGLLLSKDGKTLIRGVNGTVTIPESVTSIGCEAFDGCRGLTSVTIPNTVTSIAESAFNGCIGLETIVVGSGNKAYSSSNGLLLSNDGKKLIQGINGNVTIPSSVTSIEDSAFYGLSRLTGMTIPSSVRIIGNNAFRDCSGLTNVTIPNSVTSIGSYAFHGCSGLTSMTMSSSVTSIAECVFLGCSGLTSVTIPESVTNIGHSAFSGCSGLTSVAIPNSVTSIGDSAFRNCSSLETIVVGSGNKAYLSSNGLLLSHDGKKLIQGVNGNVTIPSSVTSIGDSAFYGRSGLTGVTIPNSVTNIGALAFGDCSGLTSVMIPDSVTSIGDLVFRSCSGLMAIMVSVGNMEYSSENGLLLSKDGTTVIEGVNGNVTIPSSVTSIAPKAFYGRGGLTRVTIPSSVTSIGDFAFYYVQGDVVISADIGTITIGKQICDADARIIVPQPDGIDFLWIDELGNEVENPFRSTESNTVSPIWRVKFVSIDPSGDIDFYNSSQTVTLSCLTDGATILYTTDGSDPLKNGIEYKYPFRIYKSCSVRAVAVKGDYRSPEAMTRFTRAESLSEAANLYGYTMETDETVPWVVDGEVSRDGVSSVRSGAIGNNGTAWLQTSIKKAGTVSFWWKAACEEADEEEGEDGYYDYGAFLVDDVVVARIAGHDGEWHYVSHEVASGGKHVLKWEYRKDSTTSYAPDCIWVDQVQWIPADGSGYTLTTPEPVPYSWLDQYNLGVGTDYETAGNAASGKVNWGRPTSVWEEYVAGLDPTDANSRLVANIGLTNGVPYISWTPDLNTNGIIRTYKIYGSETLENGGNWQYPTNSLHRFFRVKVEMP